MVNANKGGRKNKCSCNSMQVVIKKHISAEILVGYVQPSVNVSESDGVAQLTVNTSMPSGGVPNEMSIFLIVDTSDETAIGLEFGFSVLYSPLYP